MRTQILKAHDREWYVALVSSDTWNLSFVSWSHVLTSSTCRVCCARLFLACLPYAVIQPKPSMKTDLTLVNVFRDSPWRKLFTKVRRLFVSLSFPFLLNLILSTFSGIFLIWNILDYFLIKIMKSELYSKIAATKNFLWCFISVSAPPA